MKKVLAFCLTMLLVVSMGVTVFAAPGNFVSSPSKNQAPVIVGFENADADCDGEIKVTPYADRDTLPEESKKQIEAAYDDIVNSDDITDAFAKIAKDKGIPEDRLACSDLFDVSYSGCAEHDNHGKFTITLKSETFQNFAGLVYYKDGKWETVENVVLGNDGATITFTAEGFGPFAVIVDTDPDAEVPGGDDGDNSGDKPQTGDQSMTSVWVILMATSALMLILVAVKRKKASAE